MSRSENSEKAGSCDEKKISCSCRRIVRIVSILLVLGAVACLMYAVLKPRTYTATAWIQVPGDGRNRFLVNERMENTAFIETQIALMRSPMFLEEFLEIPEIANLDVFRNRSDAARRLAERLQVRRIGRSEMATVSISLPDPRVAEKVLHALVDFYVDDLEKRTGVYRNKSIAALTLERGRQESSVRLLQEKIRDATFEKERRATSRNISQEISRNESELDVLRAELKMLEETVVQLPEIPEEVVQTAVENDAELLRLQNDRIAVLENIEQLTSTILREDDPKVLTLQAKLKEIEKQMENWLARLADVKIREIQREMTGQLRQSIQEKKMSIRSREILGEDLQGRLPRESRDDSVDIEFMQRQWERQERVLDLIADRIAALQFETAVAPNPLRRKATVTTVPDGIFSWGK